MRFVTVEQAQSSQILSIFTLDTDLYQIVLEQDSIVLEDESAIEMISRRAIVLIFSSPATKYSLLCIVHSRVAIAVAVAVDIAQHVYQRALVRIQI